MAAIGLTGLANPSSAESLLHQSIGPALKQHCIQCHDADGEGGVNLLSLSENPTGHNKSDADLELISQLIDVLDLREMPPEDEPQLPEVERAKLVAHLKSYLSEAVAANRTFLHTPIRRMNRFQYNNAVVDLFDLKCIVFTLPERMMREHQGYFQPASGKMPDVVSVGSRPLGKSQMIEPRLAGVAAFPQDLRAEHGFDNRGDHLSLSPLLMEAFLKLGQSITQSPDFSPRHVGIWKTFFQPPAAGTNLRSETQKRLRPCLTRAFRSPVDDKTLDRYTTFVNEQLNRGVEFTDAMKAVAAATIASPRFLYLFDAPNNEQSHDTRLVSREQPTASSERITDLELATRLSFFLWGSLPDDDLIALANQGRLRQTDVLQSQLERMLDDRKLKRFCDSFPSQWLQLERIISSVPDRQKFPGFYFSKYRDSMHMMLEPLLLFETVLIENRSLTDLIDPDFSYRTVRLQNAYGELASDSGAGAKKAGGVAKLKFKRTPLRDRRSGGVITNTAVMTMTSGPERTQPITRGAWVATTIFNNPPEPPPADVPALGEKPADGEENMTLRERLSQHRERSDCKGCHEQIDPLGFALENYDAIGRWRNQYENGRDIDMQGTLFRTHDFDDVVEFKDAILAEKDRFTRALGGHLLSFALARPLTAADQVALDKITEHTAADDYRLQTLIKQVALSEPFLSKTIAADVVASH